MFMQKEITVKLTVHKKLKDLYCLIFNPSHDFVLSYFRDLLAKGGSEYVSNSSSKLTVRMTERQYDIEKDAILKLETHDSSCCMDEDLHSQRRSIFFQYVR